MIIIYRRIDGIDANLIMNTKRLLWLFVGCGNEILNKVDFEYNQATFNKSFHDQLASTHKRFINYIKQIYTSCVDINSNSSSSSSNIIR